VLHLNFDVLSQNMDFRSSAMKKGVFVVLALITVVMICVALVLGREGVSDVDDFQIRPYAGEVGVDKVSGKDTVALQGLSPSQPASVSPTAINSNEKFFKNTPTESETKRLSDFLTDSLEKEPKDDWSVSEEKNLLNTNQDIIKGTTITVRDSVAVCGSTMCKLSVYFNDGDSFGSDYAERFHSYYKVKGEIEGFMYTDELNKVDVYVTRPGERLPNM
jgi:hypothetical protein